MVGRVGEMDRIARLLERVRTGGGFALALTGPAGSGKSALLDAVEADATGLLVCRAYGTQSESELAFGGLEELLRPLLQRADDLAERHRLALQVSLDGHEGPAQDRLTLSVAVARLLERAAEDRPMVCLVDDAQWVDTESVNALLFAARRLGRCRIGFLFSIRDADAGGPFEHSWLPRMSVAPLPPAAARELISDLGLVLPKATIQEIIDASEGNPLALSEFAQLAAADGVAAKVGVGQPLPISERLQAIYATQARALPPATQVGLLLAAAAPAAPPDVLRTASAALTGDFAALDAAVAAGLIVPRAGRLRFRHPLVRAAVYQGASTPEVEAAHAAVADALEMRDPDLAAWHRALSIQEPNEQVAARLAATAARTRHRGGQLGTAHALHLAARLTPDPDTATLRLLAAASAARQGGSHVLARPWLVEVQARTDDPAVSADAEYELAQIAFWVDGTRSPSLPPTVRAVAAVEPARAARLLSCDLVALISDLRVDDASPIADRALQLAGRTGRPNDVAARVAHVLVMSGRSREAGALCDLIVSDATEAGDPVAMVLVAQPLWWMERYEAARRLLASAVAALSADDRLWFLARAQVYQSELERRVGRPGAAVEVARQALTLAEQLGEPMAQAEALVQMAAAEAVLGDEVQLAAHISQARRLVATRLAGTGELDLIAASAVGQAALAANRPAEASAALEPVVARALRCGVADPGVVLAVPDLIEAWIATGQLDRARPLLAWLTDRAEACDRHWARLAALRCAVGIAPSTDLAALHRAVDEWNTDGAPIHSARAWLTLGAAYRRRRMRTDARAPLRHAYDLFSAAGASVWAERARAELRACGETPAAPGAGHERLTPQELRVARLAASGARNREIAEALFVSTHTVEAHLTAVFRKFGIRSRSQLTARVNELDEPAEAAESQGFP